MAPRITHATSKTSMEEKSYIGMMRHLREAEADGESGEPLVDISKEFMYAYKILGSTRPVPQKNYPIYGFD